MFSIACTIQDPEGLHARPAVAIAAASRTFQSKISLSCRGKAASASDLMALMALDGRAGDAVEISAEGPDEQKAARAIEQILLGNE